MSRWVQWIIAVGAVISIGCTSQPATDAKAAKVNVLRDDLFPDYMLGPVETPQLIYALTSDAQEFVANTQSEARTPRENIRKLVNQIFDHAALGISYRNAANTDASTTFENSAANCLSLSIMTYAMASYAGLSPQFYQVDIPEYWTRREGTNLLNGHINLRISPPKAPNKLVFSTSFADVDFDPQDMRSTFNRKPISKQRVTAMFYNNKGADSLLAGSYSEAYRYFKAAVTVEPSLSQAWVNLGVLYRRMDENASALASYQRALRENPSHLTAWENLAILYKVTGRITESEEILARLARERDENPFYHIMLGEEALALSAPEKALTHFRAALRRDRNQHEIYFGLAKAYYALGNTEKAESLLAKAARLVPGEDMKARYQSKLLALQSS